MRQGAGPYKLGGMVSNLLKGLHLETKAKEQTCILAWDEVVGEHVAKVTQPDFVRDGVMFVVIKNSVWANELQFLKKDLISKLNGHAGSVVIKEIIFKVGRVSKGSLPKSEESGDKPDLRGIELTDEEKESVEEATRSTNPEMRDSMRKLLTTYARLEKWKLSQGWVPCTKCGALTRESGDVCPVCRMS
jgi:predicted nucleic acid-binding Zn ribbon protein